MLRWRSAEYQHGSLGVILGKVPASAVGLHLSSLPRGVNDKLTGAHFRRSNVSKWPISDRLSAPKLPPDLTVPVSRPSTNWQ
jgi:hypothetical protein